MALPLIISMLIQALYNIVDSIFVSRISEDALTAVSLVFPVQNLMIAFATGTGVGMNALLSRRLGEKNREAAEEVANVGLLLSICTAVVFALFGVFGSQLYFSMQKGVSPIIAEYGDASSMESVLLGGLSGQRRWMDQAANPESYVDRHCPPFLFLSGTKDQVVSIVQTMHFAAKIMHEAGMDKVRFQTVEGAHHNIHDFEQEWIYDLEAQFLRDTMQ